MGKYIIVVWFGVYNFIDGGSYCLVVMLICNDGSCICVVDCVDKECGSDGCGEFCGTCAGGFVCSVDGICIILNLLG